MAGEIQAPIGTPDLTVYALIRNAAGQVWQTTTSTFVTYVDANVGNYDIPLIEQGTRSGYYVGDFPAAVVAAGAYGVVVYQRAGGSPTATDAPKAEGSVRWGGTAEVSDGATWPVTLAEVKAHLRVDGTDEDTYISGLIDYAVWMVETETGQRMLTQTRTKYWDRFPGAWPCTGIYYGPYYVQSCRPPAADRQIVLPDPPLQSVTSIRYLIDGVLTTLGAGTYTVDAARKPGRIVLNDGQSWPDTDATANAVRIDYVCGHGDDADDVPASFKQAIKWLVANAYENREPVLIGQAQSLPLSVAGLLQSLTFRNAYGA